MTEPGRKRVRLAVPSCPIHGTLSYRQETAAYECPGWDGEGCFFGTATVAELVAPVRAQFPGSELDIYPRAEPGRAPLAGNFIDIVVRC